MRRLMTFSSVTAILLLAANAAFAQMQTGNWYFYISNWDNGGGNPPGVGPAWVLPTGPTATTDGAIWVKTGRTYALNTADVNIELDFRTAPGQPTILITDTCLLSNGVANGDVVLNSSGACYPGYFNDCFTARDVGAPYLVTQSSNNAYWLPTALNADPTNFQFDASFWRGTETSYAAAVAAGEDVAQTGWFKAGPMMINLVFPFNSAFAYMPSVVLQPTLPGDANGDGTVDINDLTIVLANYGQTGMTWSQGEFTGDGTVDINDLTIVLANYGQSLSSSVPGMEPVPEPRAVALLIAGLAGLLAYAPKKHNYRTG